MCALRPLPPRPSLEFDRKQAKALLRQLRAGDPDALVRARERHPGIDVSQREKIALADAQLVVAREYGFTSWPRLVQYHGSTLRHRDNTYSLGTPANYENNVRWLLAEHREKLALAGRRLAANVPRFYGMRGEEVLASAITVDDARLVVARGAGFPSWEVLIENATTETREVQNDWEVTPRQRASNAMESANLVALQNVVAEHPDLLLPSREHGHTLIGGALHWEQKNGREAMRPIVEWLAQQGQDLQRELDKRLCGGIFMQTEDARYLLQRGANPNWIAPNGISVLEHALIVYRNGDAVDLVAEHVAPRNAFWIAAGLGDLKGMCKFFDRHGKLVPAARLDRPPFSQIGRSAWPQLPDPDDEELLMEAFMIAFQNGRVEVVEYLLSHGCDANSLYWGTPFILIATTDGPRSLVEPLMRAGANPDLWSPTNKTTAREMLLEFFERPSAREDLRDIVKLFGMDPDAILAERDAKPLPKPEVAPKLRDALNLAADDAYQLGSMEVGPENLLYGLFRFGELPLMFFTRISKMDRERFANDVAQRVQRGRERVAHAPLPMHPGARALLDAAIAMAAAQRREDVTGLHLLCALLRDEQSVAAKLLTSYGGDLEFVRKEIERSM